MGVERSVVYRTSDGIVHATRALAELHEQKLVVIGALEKAVPSLDKKVVHAILNSLVSAGWRPPKRKRGPNKVKPEGLKLGSTR